jgi:hypothetical protein
MGDEGRRQKAEGRGSRDESRRQEETREAGEAEG